MVSNSVANFVPRLFFHTDIKNRYANYNDLFDEENPLSYRHGSPGNLISPNPGFMGKKLQKSFLKMNLWFAKVE